MDGFVIKDSGARQSFVTGSVRDTRDGKGRWDLIPFTPMMRLAQHFEGGAKKYGDRNWEKGQPLSRYIDSATRHLFKYIGGMQDEDHLIACVWNIFAFIETQKKINAGELPKELDDFSSIKCDTRLNNEPSFKYTLGSIREEIEKMVSTEGELLNDKK